MRSLQGKVRENLESQNLKEPWETEVDPHGIGWGSGLGEEAVSRKSEEETAGDTA